MGTDYSMLKNRTVSPSDEGMTVRVRNNLHPLHFHQVHGDNVTLRKNGTVACRSEGFCKGIAFSDRPVMVCEPVYIKFLDISSNWSGALRIGFTMNDPISLKSKLPRYACPDLTSTHGNWAKAIAERLAKKDSVLFYYVDQTGDVHYGIDSEEYGYFFGGVNISHKLWAVLDIYGNTVAVEFVDPVSVTQECQNEDQSGDSLSRNRDSRSITGDFGSTEFNDLRFHQVHGKNILLRDNKCVAARKRGFQSRAYAFTERPLKIGEKLVIQILETDNFYQGNLVYGVTTCDPSSLESYQLPEFADDLLDRPEYWIVKQDSNLYHTGETIIYGINSAGEVRMCRNGAPTETLLFYVDPTQPLWFFINLTGSSTEIRIIGASDNHICSNLVDHFEPLKISPPQLNADEPDVQPGPSSQSPSVNECVICCEEAVDCAFYRCGHMCMCHECAMKIWKPGSNVLCPMCRKIVEDVIKIYR